MVNDLIHLMHTKLWYLRYALNNCHVIILSTRTAVLAYPAKVDSPANTQTITRALRGCEFENMCDMPIIWEQMIHRFEERHTSIELSQNLKYEYSHV